MLTSLKLLFSAVLIWMCYQVIDTSLKSNLLEEWNYLAGIPWMRATLWDFYANVLVLSAWVCFKENSLLLKIFWIILFSVLGSIGTCAYVLVQLFKLKAGEPVKNIFAANQ